MILPQDLSISLILESLRTPFFNSFFTIISFLGHPLFWMFIFILFYWEGKRKYSFYLANLILFSSVLTYLLKLFFRQLRPFAYDISVVSLFGLVSTTANQSIYGFPSGHATLATAAFLFLFNKINKTAKIIASIFIFLVAFSRIYLGYHFLSDVIAGLFFGYLIYLIFTKLKEFEKFLSQTIFFVLFFSFYLLVFLSAVIFLELHSVYYLYIAFFLSFFFGFFVSLSFHLPYKKPNCLCSIIFLSIVSLFIIFLSSFISIYKILFVALIGFLIALLPTIFFYLESRVLGQLFYSSENKPKKKRK